MCYIQRYLTLKLRHAKVDLTQQEQAYLSDVETPISVINLS